MHGAGAEEGRRGRNVTGVQHGSAVVARVVQSGEGLGDAVVVVVGLLVLVVVVVGAAVLAAQLMERRVQPGEEESQIWSLLLNQESFHYTRTCTGCQSTSWTN